MTQHAFHASSNASARLAAIGMDTRLLSPPFDPLAIKALHAKKGEHILDVGCGEGHASFLIQAMGADCTGVDTDPSALAKARAKGVKTVLQTAETLFFEEEFDAAFTYGALHWYRRPNIVADSVWHALKRGGRFVGSLPADGDMASLLDPLLAHFSAISGADARYLLPWYLPSPEDWRARLEAAGFSVARCDLKTFSRPAKAEEVSGLLKMLVLPFSDVAPAGDLDDQAEAVRAKLPETVSLQYASVEFEAVRP
ncbi:hypothetical protein FACS1894186_7720 [Alphaproteobacteria bacterium]|nr:hypothetical protein FACS1894186_7720 [Alphaproteobacteria bacterium]